MSRLLRRHLLIAIAVAVSAVVACASRAAYRDIATTTAVQHLHCDVGNLRVDEVKRWAFHAVGCGRDGWFRCHQKNAKVCCEPVATEEEATAVFAEHPHGGHFTGDGQVCEVVTE